MASPLTSPSGACSGGSSTSDCVTFGSSSCLSSCSSSSLLRFSTAASLLFSSPSTFSIFSPLSFPLSPSVSFSSSALISSSNSLALISTSSSSASSSPLPSPGGTPKLNAQVLTTCFPYVFTILIVRPRGTNVATPCRAGISCNSPDISRSCCAKSRLSSILLVPGFAGFACAACCLSIAESTAKMASEATARREGGLRGAVLTLLF